MRMRNILATPPLALLFNCLGPMMVEAMATISTIQAAVYLCLASSLLGRLNAYPAPEEDKSVQSTWFNLFAADGSIKREALKEFPLYEYVYQDYEYGEQIWSDCGKKIADSWHS